MRWWPCRDSDAHRGAAAPALAAQEPSVDALDGQRLYLGACTNCHGPDGNSVPGVDSRMPVPAASTDEELARSCAAGYRERRCRRATIPLCRRPGFVAYLRWLAASGQTAVVTGDPFAARRCSKARGSA